MTRRPRWPTLGEAAAAAVALTVGVVVTMAVYSVLRPHTWAPLGPYPTQTVISQGPRVNGNGNIQIPQVHLGSEVEVNGTKCAAESVAVQGTTGWRSVEPAGFFYSAPPGPPGYRIKGCSAKLTFLNSIPPEVDAWARHKLAAGHHPQVYIGGCETPTRPNGEEGATLCWRTEPFLLVP